MSDKKDWVDLSRYGYSVRIVEFSQSGGAKAVHIRGSAGLDRAQARALSDLGFVQMPSAAVAAQSWLRQGGGFTLKELRSVFPEAAVRPLPSAETYTKYSGRSPFDRAPSPGSRKEVAAPAAGARSSQPIRIMPRPLSQVMGGGGVAAPQTAPASDQPAHPIRAARPQPLARAIFASVANVASQPTPARRVERPVAAPSAKETSSGSEPRTPASPRPAGGPVAHADADGGKSAPAARKDEADSRPARTTASPAATRSPLPSRSRPTGANRDARPQEDERASQSQDASSPAAPSIAAGNEPDDAAYAFTPVNAFQARYEPASRAGEPIATIPLNMAAATKAALARVVREKGDIDEWVSERLGWDVDTMARHLSPEQIDATALALFAAERGRGFILADQTGLGKGRILAALARAAALDGRRIVFLTEKANLFTDFWRDVRDTDSEEVLGTPFLVNEGSKIVDPEAPGAPTLHAAPRKADAQRAIRAKTLPDGCILTMATYSQFSRKGTLKSAFLRDVAEGAFVICDESHNAVGDSNTSEAIAAALGVSYASTYSSATFARNAENMAAYASVLPPSLATGNVAEILRAGGQPLQEALSQMLAEDGVLIRREHDLSNLRIEVHDDAEREERNKAYADALAPILARMARLARIVDAAAEEKNDENGVVVEGQETQAAKKAARERWYTANFGARLSAVLRQFVTALKVDQCVDKAVEALRQGMKPVIVIEGTMEALMRELAADDGGAGDYEAADLGQMDLVGLMDPDADEDDDAGPRPPDFRNALALMLDRVTTLSVKRPGADPEKIPVDRPDIVNEANEIRELIIGFPDLPLSPIDDVRDRIEAEGKRLFEAGEIPAPWVADEISARGMRVRDGAYVPMPSRDRNGIIAAFNSGMSHALVVTRAGSTGLSLHASERVADQRKRRMIELQIPSNVVERVQFWGRVNRRGQVCEPDFLTLSTGLPFEMRMLAMQNRKVAELSANVTASADSAAAMEVPDLLDSIGNEVCKRLLEDRPSIAERMCIGMRIDPEAAEAELYFANKLLSRLVLLPSDLQDRVFAGVVSAYEDAVREMASKGAHPRKARELEGAWRVVSREVHEPGDPRDGEVFGRPVNLTVIQSQRTLKPFSGEDVAAAVSAARERLDRQVGPRQGRSRFNETVDRIEASRDRILAASLNQRFRSVPEALRSSAPNAVKAASERINALCKVLRAMEPGLPMTVPDEDGQPVLGVVLDVRMPATPEEAHQPGKWLLRYVSPGDEKPREVSIATLLRDSRYVLHPLQEKPSYIHFDKAPRGETTVTRKVLDGNLVAAVRSAREAGFGTATSYFDEHGVRRRGVLVPKGRQNRIEAMPGRTKSPEAAYEVVRLGGQIYTNPEKRSAGVIIRADAGMAVIEIPAGKRAAKAFETKELVAITGEFREQRWYREARLPPSRLVEAIGALVTAGHEFHFEGRYRSAALATGNGAATPKENGTEPTGARSVNPLRVARGPALRAISP